MTREPIATTEIIRGVLIAGLAVPPAFELWTPTPGQIAALLGVYTAISAALSRFARRRSTPTTNVALTHQDVALIEATKEN